jgi:hypothetical protein
VVSCWCRSRSSSSSRNGAGSPSPRCSSGTRRLASPRRCSWCRRSCLVAVKIGALWLVQQGRATLGIAIVVVAKVRGTALVGRLIILVEPQLMAFAWFARCVAWRGRRAIGAGQCCDNRSSGAAHA